MLKEVSPRYQTLTDGAMASTDVLTSTPTGIQYKDSFAVHLIWTGTPVGTFAIQGSVDYNPGLPQSGAGPYNAGHWEPLPLVDQFGIAPVAAGSANSNLINLEFMGFPWIRAVYTNASGTGVLNIWIYAKSAG